MRFSQWTSGRLFRKILFFTAFMVFSTVFMVMRNGIGQEAEDAMPKVAGRKARDPSPGRNRRGSSIFAPLPSLGSMPFLGYFFGSNNDSLSNKRTFVQRWYLPHDHSGTFYGDQEMADLDKLSPEQNPLSDRIESQLLYKADLSTSETNRNAKLGINEGTPAAEELKTIYLAEGTGSWGVPQGREWFLKNQCPVDTCALTGDASMAETAHALLTKTGVHRQRSSNRADQVWILYLLESPLHTPNLQWAKNIFNWTATYRMDSDIVAPYEKFVLYDPSVHYKDQSVNYAALKTGQGKVAWFVSNCNAHNNRLQYAKELSQYITVDIYGNCGDKRCGRHDVNCDEMLKHDYKFYLAFENSNCRWYITEKFWINALQSLTIPIVMGAPLADYQHLAPFKSFIHVDQFPDGPKALAEYLHQLDSNDTLYNEYFAWRGTGQLINTFFFCRLCALLHANMPAKAYENMDEWWRGADICRK